MAIPNPKTDPKHTPNKIDENERRTLLGLTQNEQKRADSIAKRLENIHKILKAPGVSKKEYDQMMRESEVVLKDVNALGKEVDNFRRNAGRMFKH